MMIKGKPIGVLEAVNKIGRANYTEEDVTTLETLAAQAGSGNSEPEAVR